MKKKNLNIEYVAFERDGLEDFRSVILPDIYGDLFITEDFADRAIIAVGALSDGIPVGAVIGLLAENGVTDLKSIYVDPEYRLCGIGTELLRAVVTVTHDRVAETVNTEESYVLMGIHVTYVLYGRELTGFEAWLKNAGFEEFTEHPDVYLFEGTFPQINMTNPDGVRPLSELPDVKSEDMENLLRDMGIAPVTDLCFTAGNPDDPDLALLTASPDGELFYVLSAGAGEETSAKDYTDLAARVFDEIRRKAPDASVFVDTAMNLYPKFWKRLSQKATVLKKREAAFYLKFDDHPV